jgi:hypothetical protein
MKESLKILFINLVIFFTIIGFIVFIPILTFQTYQLIKIILPQSTQNTEENKNISQEFLKEYSNVQYRYRDFVVKEPIPFNGEIITIKEDGNRFTSLLTNYDKNTPKYLFFGSSTIWGYGVDNEKTIPSIFATKYNMYSLNYADVGYSVRQSLEKLINLYVDYDEPRKNIILFNDGPMDAFLLNTQKELKLHTIYTKNIEESIKSNVPLSFSYLINPLNAFISKINSKSSKKENEEINFEMDKEKIAFTVNQIIKTWNLANSLAISRNDQFIAILPPITSVGTPILKNLTTKDLKKLEKLAYMKEIYSLIIKNMKEYPDIKFIDLSDIFNDKSECYSDFSHYTYQGNIIYAEELKRRLNNILSIGDEK